MKLIVGACVAVWLSSQLVPAAHGQVPGGWRAKNVQTTGYLRLDGPRTFKLGLRQHAARCRQGGIWALRYTGPQAE